MNFSNDIMEEDWMELSRCLWAYQEAEDYNGKRKTHSRLISNDSSSTDDYFNYDSTSTDKEAKDYLSSHHHGDGHNPVANANKRLRISSSSLSSLSDWSSSVPPPHSSDLTNNVSTVAAIVHHTYHLPRIPKQDIRRHYATMWINTFNYFDPALLFHFIQRYSSDSIEYEDCTRGREIFLTGASPIALLNGIVMPMVPDLTLRLHDCKIVQSSTSEECHIDFTIAVQGCAVFHIPIEDILEDFATELYPDQRRANTQQLPPQISTHSPYKPFPLNPSPTSFDVLVQHRFHLDAQKRIQRIRLMTITST